MRIIKKYKVVMSKDLDRAIVVHPDVMGKPKKIEVIDMDPVWFRDRLVDDEWVREYDPGAKAPF